MQLSEKLMAAAEVRQDGGLPSDGRAALPQIARLEAIFRDVLAPDIPAYDVDSDSDLYAPSDWTYSEGFGTFVASSLSVEVNLRLALAAADWSGAIEKGSAARTARLIDDKWEPHFVAENHALGKSVWFPPGGNMHWIINFDNVRRAFATDETWMCKPHPVAADDHVEKAMVLPLGPARVYDRHASGMALLRQADTVGHTTASEMGILAMLLGKRTVDFTRYSHEAWGRYFPLYRTIRESADSPPEVLDRILSCPWSGYVPLDTSDDEAGKRFAAFAEKAREIHERCRPLTQLPPRPAGEM